MKNVKRDHRNYFSQIPFPAITICTESKTDTEKANLTAIIKKFHEETELTENEEKALEALYQICDLELEPENVTLTKVNYIQELREINNDFLDECEVSTLEFKYKKCSDFFHEIVTDEGICYTFNMLDYKDLYTKNIVKNLQFPKHNDSSSWDVRGYKNTDPKAYPMRVLGSGKQTGLNLEFAMRKKDVDYACKGAANGFRLTLHAPDEFPRPSSHFYRIPFGAETLIAINPRGISTSENLENYKPNKRQCFFPGEKRLEFFKSYTQTNCKLECHAGKCNLIIS